MCYLLATLEPSKMGLTAPSSFGNAAERNLFKRRLREIFRKHQHEIPKPLKIVIYPLRRAKNSSYLELEEEFIALLKKI
jgi:ribonuclease P protein component